MGKKKVNKFTIPSVKQDEKIRHMLRTLGLEMAALSFPKINERIQKVHGTHLDFFESVLEMQTLSLEESRCVRWVQQAKFPAIKTFEEFDFSWQPTIDRQLINELRSFRFIEEGKNVIFLGPEGVGKTHLSIALGVEAINHGFSTRFLKLDELIDLVEKATEEASPKLLRNLVFAKLLILDDIDFYDTRKNAGAFLFKLVSKRNENKVSTVFTSNKAFREWEGLFGDRGRGPAAIGRILERVAIINIDGHSYRVKDKMNALEAVTS